MTCHDKSSDSEFFIIEIYIYLARGDLFSIFVFHIYVRSRFIHNGVIWLAFSSLYVCHASLLCVTCLIQVWDMTHPYAWYASLICVTCLTHMCDMTRFVVLPRARYSKYVCDTSKIAPSLYCNIKCTHDSFMHVTCLIYMCDSNHSYLCPLFEMFVWHDKSKSIFKVKHQI